MTRNQIMYQQLQETKRSNLVNESLTAKRDRNTFALGMLNYSEAQRHNLAYEAEVSRHNRAVEDNAAKTLELTSIDVDTRRRQADTQRYTAETQRIQALEQQRHNKATESFSYAQLNEQSRHNKATEAVAWSQAAEIARHNKASEDVSRSQVIEMRRHNTAGELMQYKSIGVSQQQADTAQYRAETDRYVAEYEEPVASSQAALNEQRTAESHASTKYTKGKNTREWINTGVNVVSSTVDMATGIVDSISRAVTAGSNALRAFSMVK